MTRADLLSTTADPPLRRIAPPPRAVTLPDGLERNRLLDSAQSAALIGYSLAHFRRLYKTGKIPSPIQINGRKMGWPAGTLIDFLVQRQAMT